MSNVVPFRPRDQVPRRIGSFRSDPRDFDVQLSARLRIHGSVSVRQIIRAFRSVGVDWKLDERTGEIVACRRKRRESRLPGQVDRQCAPYLA
jgi:hypothetical protein